MILRNFLLALVLSLAFADHRGNNEVENRSTQLRRSRSTRKLVEPESIAANYSSIDQQIVTPPSTIFPTMAPTVLPAVPLITPTQQPVASPSTSDPTMSPTVLPAGPFIHPTQQLVAPTSTSDPTMASTVLPTVPLITPTQQPVIPPSTSVQTMAPTVLPAVPLITPTQQPDATRSTIFPTMDPTDLPTVQFINPTKQPVVPPSTIFPTMDPTILPSVPFLNPTQQLVVPPSTIFPTMDPTVLPSPVSFISPTQQPVATPSTIFPTIDPTVLSSGPSITPTQQPVPTPSTIYLTMDPTVLPSAVTFTFPTHQPVTLPSTIFPTMGPTVLPALPLNTPTQQPVATPLTIFPTMDPTVLPTAVPFINPTQQPLVPPSTIFPTMDPTILPSVPFLNPTQQPVVPPSTIFPTMDPTVLPSPVPFINPTHRPIALPSTIFPTMGQTVLPVLPLNTPTQQPVATPSIIFQSMDPTIFPSTVQFIIPIQKPVAPPSTGVPTMDPILLPTTVPILNPTQQPVAPPSTSVPTMAPVVLPSEPFITSATANELVTIPDPPAPSFFRRSSCPHEDNNLIDWHSPATWSGAIPTSGHVTLPENARVVVRQSVSGVFGTVTVPSSSELLFDENDSGITFDAHGIDVKGKLTIGSETCRIETPVTITLHGDRPNDAVTNVRPPIYKGISVTGEISIHGKRFYRTWTRLALTVEPGDSILMLQNEVNWISGQQIVLVTTAMKDSREWHRNEVASVKKVILNPVEGVGAAVFLQAPAVYQHVANRGYQGEVGLLTRVVKIQGNLASEPADPDPLNCKQTRSNLGDKSVPCPNTELTGFGGHVMVHGGGKGYVEGVELYHMGQTNVLGRYPMHFHLLGESCRDCYFRDSSIHRSFYRCISIHGTHYTLVSENVAYDVNGFCYYLEDGVEHDNRIEFNLGAHIHLIGPELPWAAGQSTETYQKSDILTLPADVAASAFYITNIHNYIIGNAASGGWAGFAFPALLTPLGPHRNVKLRPSSVTGLTIDGNTAHSTGWWWKSAAAFYFGGSLYYNDEGILEYQAGRDLKNRRETCLVNKCNGKPGSCGDFCRPWEQAWVQVSNTKAFLVAGAGLGSWSGRMDVHGYETHDCSLSMESLSDGFSARDMLAVCRTKSPIILPENVRANRMNANGFRWYDTNQEHIITKVTFRNCGYRSDEFDQYDQGSSRGCGDETDIGCTSESSVWSMLTHSDKHVPEMMQATRAVSFENCGRRFLQRDWRQNTSPHPSSNSGRSQNWYDIDGTITGFGERSVAASGLADTGMWWQVDTEVVYDPQGPLWFFKLGSGPERGLGHFNMLWDDALHAQLGKSQCGNSYLPCDYVGYIKHLGPYFNGDAGLPVTANANAVGPVGGFGWKLELDNGAPKSVRFHQIEVDPATPLLLSIAYPLGTSFTLVAHGGYCTDNANYTCEEMFHQVGSVADVRTSLGNTYHVDSNGVLTFRIIQLPQTFVGRPEFFLPQYTDLGRDGLGFALERFERDGVRLPSFVNGPYLKLDANCPSSGAYCSKSPSSYQPEVCPSGYSQTGYDTCTSISDANMKKLFADGTVHTE